MSFIPLDEKVMIDSNESKLASPPPPSSSPPDISASWKSLMYKLTKTLSIILTWVCIGLWAEVNGPTMPDLIYRTGSNYELISQAISMRGAGSLTGAVLGGGLIVDRFHKQVELILAICLVCCTGLNVAVPYCYHVEGLYAIFAIEGWLEAIVNIAGQVVVLDLWKDKASGPLHLAHLGFGVGSFLVPQIVSNFISDELPKIETEVDRARCDVSGIADEQNDTGLVNGSTVTTTPLNVSTNFQYGFIIVSAIILAIALVWLLFAYLDRKKTGYVQDLQERSIRQALNLNTCSPGQPIYALILYCLLFLWIYVAVAGERIFAKYLYSYARGVACFSKQTAIDIIFAFWVSFTAGRFLGFLLSNFLHMKYIIFIEGFGNLASVIVLYFFGTNYYVLWICTCVSGVLIGPCYPSGLSWANRYMVVTATGVTVLSVGAGISDISFLFTIGYFINKLGISVVITFLLGFGVVVSILPVLMTLVTCRKGDRFEGDRFEEKPVELAER